jgi:hypothetical protein
MDSGAGIFVVHLPGLSARALREHHKACPALEPLMPVARFATVAPLAISPTEAQAALWTGMLPHHNALEFWHKAAKRRPDLRLDIRHEPDATTPDAAPHLCLRTINVNPSAPLPGLETASELMTTAPKDARLMLVASWAATPSGEPAGPDCHPLDRPVLVTRGLEQPRTVMGLCEIAGLLERTLTGERLHDEA